MTAPNGSKTAQNSETRTGFVIESNMTQMTQKDNSIFV